MTGEVTMVAFMMANERTVLW